MDCLADSLCRSRNRTAPDWGRDEVLDTLAPCDADCDRQSPGHSWIGSAGSPDPSTPSDVLAPTPHARRLRSATFPAKGAWCASALSVLRQQADSRSLGEDCHLRRRSD